MNRITANQLKTKGVSIIEDCLSDNPEIIITVRGQEKYVVMDMNHYAFLRECELETALHEARAEYEAGNYVVESVDDHMKRLKNDV
jgi:PHD/YefM family antitoxin component YafN of YafNO toxin-antitoxin module